MDFAPIRKVVQLIEGSNYALKGTCFFIDPNIAITAKHVVFGKKNLYIQISEGRYLEFSSYPDDNYDFSILITTKPLILTNYLELNAMGILKSENWESYGFPANFETNGYPVKGEVLNSETIEDVTYDITLNMIPDPKLTCYEGMSGAPVIINGMAEAIITRKTNGTTISGVKIIKCLKLLRAKQVRFRYFYSKWINDINQRISNNDTNILIEREGCVRNLKNFIREGSGLVIGEAGIGKSFLLKKSAEDLIDEGLCVIYIAIDEFVNENVFNKELGLSSYTFVDKLTLELSKIQDISKKTIIIFDAFDSARNEEIQKYFLHIIENLNCKMSNSCNIIVSCRIYDARLSLKLQELFQTTQNPNDDIKCRHISIEPLNDFEVTEALKQIGIVDVQYESTEIKLKTILRIPFNLWLVEKIFKINKQFDIMGISSMVELLDTFWNVRISGQYEQSFFSIINKIVTNMIQDKKLVVVKNKVFDAAFQLAWNELYSCSILNEEGFSRNKVVFSHAILFDYAVSKTLFIDEIDNDFIQYIERDLSRCIFIMPSVRYLFDILWYRDKNYFWRLTEDFMAPGKIPYIIKIVPIRSLIYQVSDKTELSYIIEKYKNKEPIAINILYSIFLSIDVYGLFNYVWLNVICEVFLELQEAHLGLIIKILCKNIDTCNENGKKTIGDMARVFFERIHNSKNSLDFNWLYNLSRGGLIPILCKTYYSNMEDTKKIVNTILDNMDADGNNIGLISALAENCHYIFKFDYEFLAEIYLRIYTTVVINDTVTTLGNPGVLTFTSNRKQDYDLCKYTLSTQIPDLFHINPFKATILCTKVINSLIYQGRQNCKYNNISMCIRCNEVKITLDNMYRWMNLHSDISSYVDAIFNYLDELALHNDIVNIDRFLDIFIKNAKTSLLWINLLKTASKHPHMFLNNLFDICMSLDVLLHTDMIYETMSFIEASYHLLEPSRKKLLLDIVNRLIVKNESEIDLKNRLLNCFVDQFSNENIKEENVFIKTRESKNFQPYDFRVELVETTYQDKLINRGLDLNNKEPLYDLLIHLHDVDMKILNRAPMVEEYTRITGLIKDMSNILIYKNNINIKLQKEAWNEVSIGLKNIASAKKFYLLNNDFEFYISVVSYIVDLNYFDEEETDFKSMTSGYVPTAKHNVIDLLYDLATLRRDIRIVSAVNKLLAQKSNSLKCLLAMGLFILKEFYSIEMWSMIHTLLNFENAEIKKYTIYSLGKLLAFDKKRVSGIVQHIVECDDVEIIDKSIDLVLYFYIYEGEMWAKETIGKVLIQPWVYKYDTSSGYIPILFDILQRSIENDDTNRTAIILNIIKSILDTCIGKVIKININIQANSIEAETRNLLDRIYHVIDFLLLKLFFTSGADSTNNKRDKLYEKRYYFNIKPILEDISNYLTQEEFFVIPLSTMHRTIQLINSLFEYDPCSCIKYIKDFVISGQKTNYVYDSLAISETLKLMKKLFADYRSNLKDDLFLNDVITILDCFSKTGDANIIEYLWRFEDIYR